MRSKAKRCRLPEMDQGCQDGKCSAATASSQAACFAAGSTCFKDAHITDNSKRAAEERRPGERGHRPTRERRRGLQVREEAQCYQELQRSLLRC